MLMIEIVLLLLHTKNWSWFLGSRCTLCTGTSALVVPPSDLNVAVHSVDFKLHNLIVPSEEPLEKERLRKCKINYTIILGVKSLKN